MLTDLGTVRVVGTRFAVTSRPGRDMVVEVFEGRVAVLDVDGREVASVGAGESATLGRPLPAGPRSRNAVASESSREASAGIPARRRLPAVTVGAQPAAVAGGGTPTAADVDRLRGLLSGGRTEEALAGISQAMAAATPAMRTRLLALLGDAHRLAGRFDLARQAYESALAMGGDGAPEGIFPDLASLLRQDLGRWEDAAGVWRAYVQAHPSGRYASQALWALARPGADRPYPPDADTLMRRIVAGFPRAPEAVFAFVEVGRGLLDAGDIEGAEAWFRSVPDSPTRPLAEASLVGRMRCLYDRQDRAGLLELAERHAREFPDGARRDEVHRLVQGMGVP